MNLTDELQALRREYQSAELSRASVDDSPIVQLQQWLKEAISAQSTDATAMVLSTANTQGQPSSRVVLLKGLNEQEQLLFYTHYDSHKGQDLAQNPLVAINFHWPLLERQISIQGQVETIPAENSDAYFQSRPRESQISAWASHQSQVVPSREALVNLQVFYEAKFKDEMVPRPENWGGYAVTPTFMEFWQGRAERLHDRIAYRLNEDRWEITRLAP